MPRHPMARGASDRFVPLSAIVLLALTACGGSEAAHGDGAWHGSADTAGDGTVVVRNPGRGIWTRGQAWRIEEELRIGRTTGQGPELFSSITALAVDSSDRILVADAEAREIRIFATDGRHVRSFGGAGAGPGELDWVSALEVMPDGRILAVDMGHQRYTLFDSSGRFVEDRPREQTVTLAYPWRTGLDDDGRVVDVGWRDGGRGSPRLEALDADFGVLATWPLPYPSDHFGPDLVWRFDPEGFLWFGREDRYRIVQRRLEGDTVRIVERDVKPEPYSREERRSMAARARGRVVAVGKASPDGEGGQAPDVNDMPEHRPLYEALWTDGAGRLWVAPWTGDESSTVDGLDVFDPRGRYLGRALSGFPLRPSRPEPVVRGDRIWAVTEDSLGVQYVVRGRIVRPAADDR